MKNIFKNAYNTKLLQTERLKWIHTNITATNVNLWLVFFYWTTQQPEPYSRLKLWWVYTEAIYMFSFPLEELNMHSYYHLENCALGKSTQTSFRTWKLVYEQVLQHKIFSSVLFNHFSNLRKDNIW